MKINHINIRAPLSQLITEKQFFADVLDVKEGFRPEFSNQGFWLYSENRPIIHLTEEDLPSGQLSKYMHGNLDHFALEGTGLKSFIEKFQRLNIEYRTSYIKESETTQVFLYSPLGVKIEIQFPNEKE